METVTTSRDKIEAAVDTLEALSALGAGKPGLPEPENTQQTPQPDQGKPGLPEPEPEPEYPDYSEEDADGEDTDEQVTEITFTEKDRKDFTKLEKQATSGTLQSAQAWREIRQRQLWRLLKDDQGNQLYRNFEEYCQERHGHSRQWVTHLTNWLRIEEEKKRLGITVPITVKAAQGLLIARLNDAGGLGAVLEEAIEDGVPLDKDHLREIVIRRADYNYWSRDGKEGSTKPAAKSYGAYKRDLATVKELGAGPTDYFIIRKAKDLDGDFTDNLVMLCQQHQKLPTADSLLAMLTGKALEDVVAKLKEVGKEATDIEEKKNLLAARRKQIRAMQQEGGLKQLKEEAKALEQELLAKGVIKKKGAKPQPVPQNGQPQEEAEAEEPLEVEPSEVRDNLATALASLDDALTCDWPAAEDADELNAILIAAQDCETKLAEITAKAKELLADTEQPEAIPSGND